MITAFKITSPSIFLSLNIYYRRISENIYADTDTFADNIGKKLIFGPGPENSRVYNKTGKVKVMTAGWKLIRSTGKPGSHVKMSS